MDIEKWFFPDRVPGQMLYLGEERTLLLLRAGDGRWRIGAELPHSLADLSSIRSLPGAAPGPLGLSLGPNPFVFNLFNFESPLPLNRRKRGELIEWRLQRVFPDIPEDMVKTNLVYQRRTVLSTLIAGEVLKRCEAHFKDMGFPVTHISCSSVEAIGGTARFTRQPLMVLEQDGPLLMVTLVRNGIPLFVRKIRFSQLDELVTALRKTISFIGEQQGITADLYLTNPLGGQEYRNWIEKVPQIRPLSLPQETDRFSLFLP